MRSKKLRLQGVSNQRYRRLLKKDRAGLVERHKGEASDAGALARLVCQMEEIITLADKDAWGFKGCPLCGASAMNPSAIHRSGCPWADLIRDLREG
jgi:hypothetical protein